MARARNAQFGTQQRARARMDRCLRSALALIAALVASCAPDGSGAGSGGAPLGPVHMTPQGGGQSGTDSFSTATRCKPGQATPVSAAMLAAAPAELRARVERATTQKVVLYWDYLRAPGTSTYAVPDRSTRGVETSITIRVEQVGAQARTLQSCNDTFYLVPATLHVTTEDGKLDSAFAGGLSGGVADTAGVDFTSDTSTLGAGDDGLSGAVRALGFDPTSVTQALGATFVADGFSGSLKLFPPAGVFDADLRLGDFARFASSLPRAAVWQEVMPASPLAQACARAAASLNDAPLVTEPTYDLTKWPAARQAWLQRLQGRWVLCSGAATRAADHGGMELAADGTFHHFGAQGDRVVEQLGIGHEGWAQPLVTSVMTSGELDLLFRGLPPDLEFALHARLTADLSRLSMHGGSDDVGAPIEAVDYTYLKVPDLAVDASQPPRARGEHAGAAGCSGPEAYLLPELPSSAALSVAMAGQWAFCQREIFADAASIRFDGQGRYQLIGDGGSMLHAGAYHPLGPNVMDLRDDRGNEYSLEEVMVFDAPRKLSLSLYDGERDLRREVVLSAMPGP